MSNTTSFPLQVLRSETSYASVSTLDDSEWKSQHFEGDNESQVALFGRSSGLGSHRWRKRRKINVFGHRMPTGWHFGAWLAVMQASAVLLVNVILLIYTTAKIGVGSRTGPIYTGDCNTVDRLAIGIHLVINVLSTLLLGASNYVMQSVCAPTRMEVDRAHERGSYLDIGLQSLRNLAHTSRWKRLLWFLLSASSIPLHLFYNSSFFSSLDANIYTPYLATGPDIQRVPKDNGTFDWKCSSGRCPLSTTHWEFLSPSDCLRTYAVDFLSGHRDVVVVGNHSSDNEFILYGGANTYGDNSPPDQYDWLCSDMQNHDAEKSFCVNHWREIDPSNWTVQQLVPNGVGSSSSWVKFQVEYCLSETVASNCQLQFNLLLLAIVIFFNTVKVVCITIVATRMKDDPLVTLGDAIASFVNVPQPRTKNMCLVSQKHFSSQSKSQAATIGSMPIRYEPQRVKWMETASRRHWTITVCLFLGAISIILGLFGYAVSRLYDVYTIRSASSLWQLGLGKASGETVIQGWMIPTEGYSALVASVLVSNSPQIILSIIYLALNSLCTKLFLALEWSSYSRSRKPLRVSSPRGDQRSTYFLQIPYRFGLPLMAYSALLHWLVSQSIFLVSVSYREQNHDAPLDDIISCGFSPMAMILTSIVAASLILGAVACGYFKHLDGDMPLASSCSAAIAAACHPPEGGSDILKPMKWGVVESESDEYDEDSKDLQEEVGHISFSSGDVREPVRGCLYS